METISEFPAAHNDIIHDISYDHYGTRLVTCSSDHQIKVWDFLDNEWSINDTWRGHDSAVLKASFAHPEFGQVICSCSFDRTIKIWEEQEGEVKNSGKRWSEKVRLPAAKATVQDVSFAPNHLGLKLDDFEIVSGGSKESEARFCLSWCPSRFQPQMLAIGCGKENNVKIFRVDAQNNWSAYESLGGHTGIVRDVAWAPSCGRSYQLIATACSDGHVRIFQLTPKPSSSNSNRNIFNVELVADLPDHESEVWRVEWNITGTVLVSSGDDGKLRLWKCK
ncbi:epoxide hydrolase, soluble (sEH) [Globomyces sp. JEL0801]|nr:epoxide hydrolase, soluble (sEH) [Globomyces sp. JEL0801]